MPAPNHSLLASLIIPPFISMSAKKNPGPSVPSFGFVLPIPEPIPAPPALPSA